MSDVKYQVTAIKWRPKIFETLIGQDHISKTLKNSLKSGKIAHAFIFSGPRGTGKTSTARILAKSLNCTNLTDYNPCNNCQSCNDITIGSNIDVIEIDGASNRKLEEIKTLREAVKYSPTYSKYKIFIIDEVHMLTTESFNALLKTLEEPPPNVIFILATTDIHKVPNTILSRCQRYDFRRLSMNEIKNHLWTIVKEEKIEADDEALSLISKLADGAMRDAQSLFDQMVVYSDGKVIYENVVKMLGVIDNAFYFSVTDALLNTDTAKAFNIANDVYYHGWDLSTFILGLQEHFRNILYYKSTSDTTLIEESNSTIEKYVELAPKINSNDIIRILSFLNTCSYEIKNSSNQKLYLETMLIRLVNLPPSLKVEELINEIRNLKFSNVKTEQKTERILNEIKFEEEKPDIIIKSEEPDTPLLLEEIQPVKNIVMEPSEKIRTKIQIGSFALQEKWTEIISEISKSRKVLSQALNNFVPVSFENDVLTLSYTLKLNTDQVNKCQTVLKKKIQDLTGKDIEIKCNAGSPVKQNNTQPNKDQTPPKFEELNEIERFIVEEFKGERIN